MHCDVYPFKNIKNIIFVEWLLGCPNPEAMPLSISLFIIDKYMYLCSKHLCGEEVGPAWG